MVRPALCAMFVLLSCAAPARAAAQAELEAVCEIEDARIAEASGIVCGRRNAGVFYVHNDSGGRAEVYAIDTTGAIRAVFALRGATNVDWEDISLAPGAGAGQFDVVVADIGDNAEQRAEITLYRFAEPELPAQPGESVAAAARVYRLRYPDGPHNAEALCVHPRSGDGYIVTKQSDGRARVYRLAAPWPEAQVARLESVGELRGAIGAPPLETLVTGADISPDGGALVTRSYLCAWEWRGPEGAPGFEALFSEAPRRISFPPERQGEAVCYAADGGAWLTISEGTPTTIFRVRRAAAPASKPASAPATKPAAVRP